MMKESYMTLLLKYEKLKEKYVELEKNYNYLLDFIDFDFWEDVERGQDLHTIL